MARVVLLSFFMCASMLHATVDRNSIARILETLHANNITDGAIFLKRAEGLGCKELSDMQSLADYYIQLSRQPIFATTPKGPENGFPEDIGPKQVALILYYIPQQLRKRVLKLVNKHFPGLDSEGAVHVISLLSKAKPERWEGLLKNKLALLYIFKPFLQNEIVGYTLVGTVEWPLMSVEDILSAMCSLVPILAKFDFGSDGITKMRDLLNNANTDEKRAILIRDLNKRMVELQIASAP